MFASALFKQFKICAFKVQNGKPNTGDYFLFSKIIIKSQSCYVFLPHGIQIVIFLPQPPRSNRLNLTTRVDARAVKFVL